MREAIKRNPSPNEMRAPRLGIGPKPQNARIAKSEATAVHNILKNIVPLPAAISPFLCSGTIWLWSLDESVERMTLPPDSLAVTFKLRHYQRGRAAIRSCRG